MRLSRYNIAVGLGLVLGLTILAWLLYMTSTVLETIRVKEDKSKHIVIEATKGFAKNKLPDYQDFFNLAREVIAANDYLPVILVDEDGNVVITRNCGKEDELMTDTERAKALEELKAHGTAEQIEFDGVKQTIYYGETTNLSKQLGYVRWIQFFAIAFFAVVVYAYLTRIRRRERNNIWKGLALETAHQLGTPIQGLMGWRDLLDGGYSDTQYVAQEMQKDIDRLKAVADRFSKVGSQPKMVNTPLVDDVRFVVEYLRNRISKNVSLEVFEMHKGVTAPHEPTLIRWAVENICRNAADAIDGSGSITIIIGISADKATIDIRDTGKGMDKRTRRHIFDAGFSTKPRGWGIGLALVKRIASEYHKGRVFVLESRLGEGTTFRIELPRQ